MHNNEGGNCLTFVLCFTLSIHLLAYKKSLSSPLLQTHQKIMQKIRLFSYLLLCLHLVPPCLSWNHNIQPNFRQANGYEGSSDSVNLQYHMGPVLASPVVNIYIIWYGHWSPRQQETIRDFVYSLSASATFPSLADWWKTVRLYTDQTGSNITGKFDLSEEFYDSGYSQGHFLERLAMQSIIKEATSSKYPKPLPLNPNNGLYLILTSSDVQVQDFCREVCGFHYFTFPTIVGVTVPYAWVGYSGTQCPGMCAYPFATPSYPGNPPPEAGVGGAMRPPNGDAGVDGMLSVLAHELAEVSSNPLVNAWYAGDDPTAPAEIADLCVGVYGSGGGGGYVGRVYKDHWGDGYNVNGVRGRRFLVQWVWDPARRRCFGPNAMD